MQSRLHWSADSGDGILTSVRDGRHISQVSLQKNRMKSESITLSQSTLNNEQQTSVCPGWYDMGNSRYKHHSERNCCIPGNRDRGYVVVTSDNCCCMYLLLFYVRSYSKKIHRKDFIATGQSKSSEDIPTARLDTPFIYDGARHRSEIHSRHPVRIHRFFLLRSRSHADSLCNKVPQSMSGTVTDFCFVA